MGEVQGEESTVAAFGGRCRQFTMMAGTLFILVLDDDLLAALDRVEHAQNMTYEQTF
jgi:hypothetical protein